MCIKEVSLGVCARRGGGKQVEGTRTVVGEALVYQVKYIIQAFNDI